MEKDKTAMSDSIPLPLFADGASAAERFPQVLRPYQEAALDGLMAAWGSGARAPLIAMATGLGKTTVIAEALRRLIDPRRQRALLVAHTEEIVFQLRDRVVNQFAGALDRAYGGAPGIGVVMGELADEGARVVCATRQSLHARRLPRLLARGAFDLVVIDEAHHVTGDNSYADILDTCRRANPDLRVFGVTATPKRGDGKALAAQFDALAFDYSIPKAIADGYLVPVVSRSVSTGVRLGAVATTGGDYNQAQLERALEDADWLRLALAAFLQHVPLDRPTLAFFPSVRMSRSFAHALRAQHGIAAAHIDGETDRSERRDLLRRYRDGDLRVISNVAVLTEGFDAPQTSCIFLARPTRSVALFTQIVGRGVRLYPGKTNCLLIALGADDVKLAGTAALVGDLTRCDVCDAEIMRGYRTCPVCSAAVSAPRKSAARAADSAPADDLIAVGAIFQQVSAQYVSIFASLASQWTPVRPDYFTLSLGEQGAVEIARADASADVEVWEAFYAPRGALTKTRIGRNGDLASLMGQAEAYVEAHFPKAKALTAKDAAWRSQPMTDKQRALIVKLTGRTPPDTLTKGEASQLISYLMERKR